MSDERENLPDLDEAARQVQESRRQAEQDMTRAQEQARRRLTLADRLRRLREDNGFQQMFEEAFGRG